MMQIAFVVLGALLVIAGVVLLFAVDVMTGVMTMVPGVMVAGTAFTVLPKFKGMVGNATAQVDALAHKNQLAMTGLPAMGRLLYVQQTGRMVNFNPEVLASVEVHHPQMGPYQVQTTVVVPQIAIPRMQPGAQVEVRVNPQNPQDVAIVV
jgi:hypothetical protein